MKKNIDLTLDIQQFIDTITNATIQSGIYKPTMLVRPVYAKRNDLTQWLTKEELIKGRHYTRNEKMNGILLSPLKEVNTTVPNSEEDCIQSISKEAIVTNIKAVTPTLSYAKVVEMRPQMQNSVESYASVVARRPKSIDSHASIP
uniref:Uncharacterized protein n=1 Tax=Acrobeloides nanus TaxID=290746 RepID=A0A914E166_9BILA